MLHRSLAVLANASARVNTDAGLWVYETVISYLCLPSYVYYNCIQLSITPNLHGSFSCSHCLTLHNSQFLVEIRRIKIIKIVG